MSRYYCVVRLVVWTHYVGVGLGNKRVFTLGEGKCSVSIQTKSRGLPTRFPSTSSDAEATVTDFCFFLDPISDFAHYFVRIVVLAYRRLFV